MTGARVQLFSKAHLPWVWVALCAGCTIGPALEQDPEAVAVTATEPGQYELDVARDATISFWFSRPLDPASFGAAAIDVTSHEVRQGGTIRYDPIDRRLSFVPRGTYRRDLAYDAVLTEALRGLRRGEPVAPTTLTFMTGLHEDGREEVETASFETDVLPLFQRSCVSSACHGPPRNAASIDLSSAYTAAASLIDVRSAGWAGWPRVSPGSAAWSYLVYKILGEESVRGEAMPPGDPLPLAELQAVASWIDGGAKVDGASGDP